MNDFSIEAKNAFLALDRLIYLKFETTASDLFQLEMNSIQNYDKSLQYLIEITTNLHSNFQFRYIANPISNVSKRQSNLFIDY